MDRLAIRSVVPADAAAVHGVHRRTFGGRTDEARLVELLHHAGAAPVSLVVVLAGRVVGHVLFSPVELDGDAARSTPMLVGLGPIGVLPEHQRRGVGSRLVRAGLDACREAGFDAAVVLGDPVSYSRFGFERAGERGIGNEYGADAHFMIVELTAGALTGATGTVRYRPEFGTVGA